MISRKIQNLGLICVAHISRACAVSKAGYLGRCFLLLAMLLPLGCTLQENKEDRPRTFLQDLSARTLETINHEKPGKNSSLEDTTAPHNVRNTPQSDLSVLVDGTGRFTRPIRRQESLATGEDGFSLNFEESDIGEVVHAVFGEILGLNYVLDPSVKGPVTLLTSSPIPRSALLSVIENILNARGFSVVSQAGVYHILSAQSAGKSLLPVSPTGSYETFGAVIAPLKHVSAAEMAEILAPFDKSNSILRVDSRRNLLILGGSRQERETLLDVVHSFDVDWFEGMSFALVPVQSSYVGSLAKDLEQIFGAKGSGLADGILRFAPIERINALLVISSQPQYIHRVEEWVHRLDREAQAIRRRLFIYYPEHVQASYLSATLKALFSNDQSEEAYQRRQQILAPGLTPTVLSTEPEVSSDSETTSVAETEVSSPEPSGSDGDSFTLRDGVLIMADSTKNALNIMATPNEYDQILGAIKQLDTPPLQVLIEATIAEIRLTNDLRYGLQYAVESGDSSIVLSEFSSGAARAIFPGFSYLFSGNDIEAVFNALESVTDINVLSSPHLLVVDSQTAELTVGDQVPVATQSVVSVTDPDAPTVNTIEFRDTGVVLKVTPKVNASGVVNLEVEQEVSDVVATTTSGIDSPTIQQRKVKSTIMVRNGDTVVLGGLIRENNTKSSSGIPLLSSVPVVGALFGSQTDDFERTELLIVITPRVVENHDTLKAISREIRDKIGTIKLN